MSHIVIDGRMLGWTGIGRYTRSLLEELEQLDAANRYTVLVQRRDWERWTPANSNFKRVEVNIQPYSFGEQWRLPWVLYRQRADLVHFLNFNSPLLYLKKRIITVHDLTLIHYVNRRADPPLKAFYKYRLKPLVFRSFMRWAMRPATHLITPTEYVRHQVQQDFRIPDRQITCTYEAADQLAAAATPVAELKDTRFILYVGNAYPYKNLRRLIDAHARRTDQALWLVLAGKSDFFYDELAAYVQQHGLTNVRFTGFVSDAELRWLYEHALLYVFPSLSEGFGLPAVEAMLHGLPVAAAQASCLPEVLGSGAAYFDPTDTADIARTINEVLGDDALRARLKAAGLKRAQQYSWKRMAEQTLAIYNNALTGR